MAKITKYPWDEWFSQLTKQSITIRRGVDYHASQSTMCQSVRNIASKRGVKVHIVDDNDSLTIELRNEVYNTNQVTISSKPTSSLLGDGTLKEESAQEGKVSHAESSPSSPTNHRDHNPPRAKAFRR